MAYQNYGNDLDALQGQMNQSVQAPQPTTSTTQPLSASAPGAGGSGPTSPGIASKTGPYNPVTAAEPARGMASGSREYVGQAGSAQNALGQLGGAQAGLSSWLNKQPGAQASPVRGGAWNGRPSPNPMLGMKGVELGRPQPSRGVGRGQMGRGFRRGLGGAYQNFLAGNANKQAATTQRQRMRNPAYRRRMAAMNRQRLGGNGRPDRAQVGQVPPSFPGGRPPVFGIPESGRFPAGPPTGGGSPYEGSGGYVGPQYQPQQSQPYEGNQFSTMIQPDQPFTR